jgi:hypothetical protein
MDTPIPCPQCGAPAQITERFRLASTAGPVEHQKELRTLERHDAAHPQVLGYRH